MILRYNVSIDDIVAFNTYHCDHSPTIRRQKIFVAGTIDALVILAGAFYAKSNDEPAILAFAGLFAVIFTVLYWVLFRRCLARSANRLISEGSTKGVVGPHELEITDSDLIERTEVNESKHSWRGLHRVVDTPEYLFIYVTALMAHVVPKQSVTAGDIDAFLQKANTQWEAHRDSSS
jgi:YcxB-like protein